MTHTFYHLSIVIVGASLGILIMNTSLTQLDKYGFWTVRWMLCGGLASIMFFESIISLMYKSQNLYGHVFWAKKITSPSFSVTSPNHMNSRSLTVETSSIHSHPRFSKRIRLLLRLMTIITFLLIGGLAPKELPTTHLLLIIVSIFFVETCLEEYGKHHRK